MLLWLCCVWMKVYKLETAQWKQKKVFKKDLGNRLGSTIQVFLNGAFIIVLVATFISR